MIKVVSSCALIFGLLHAVQGQCGEPSPTTVWGTHAPTGVICPGQLIFEDNFDEMNLKVWNHENTLGGGGNWEFQWYANSRLNSWAEDGILHIKPTLVVDEMGQDFLSTANWDINGGSPADECTNPQWYGCSRQGTPENLLNPIKSARIRSVYSFSFKYGRLEVRAKLPAGDWLWPAIWLLPLSNQYSTWPMSGEIDLMESRGNRNYMLPSGQQIGNQLVSSTLHWGPNWQVNKYELTHWERNDGAGFSADFHNYQMEWTPDHLTFSIDDAPLGTVTPPNGGFWELGNLADSGFPNPWQHDSKMAPFDQEFYIIINVAVGGVNNFFPDDATNVGANKPWRNDGGAASTEFWNGRDQWLPTWNLDGSNDAALQVDYVRVWAL